MELEEFYHRHRSAGNMLQTATPEELCEFVRTVSNHFSTPMIVMDGLDEISNNRDDITRLLKNLNTPAGTTKTLFASRFEVDIGYELEDYAQVSIAARSSDLGSTLLPRSREE